MEYCSRGHPFEGRNLGIKRDGKKFCRECANARSRLHRRKKKYLAQLPAYIRRGGVCPHRVPVEFIENIYAITRGGKTCGECYHKYLRLVESGGEAEDCDVWPQDHGPDDSSINEFYGTGPSKQPEKGYVLAWKELHKQIRIL